MPDVTHALRVAPLALEPYRLSAVAPGAAAGSAAQWFGPQAPLPPVAPKSVAGRRFDFPPGFNLQSRPKAYAPIGFGELRALADAYDLIRLIIETRKDQLARLQWTIRPRQGEADPRCARIERFFARPDGATQWDEWLRQLIEDLLVIDAPALWCERNRGGCLVALHPIDGASLKRIIDPWGRTPRPPLPAYQQVLHGMPAVDYTAADIIYRPRNQRVHKVYGFSPVEQILVTVNIALRRQVFQLQYYTEGNIPEAIVSTPAGWSVEQVAEFQAYWDGLYSGNTAERRHAKFVPDGVGRTFIPMKDGELTGATDEWLARLCCFAFSVSPQPFVRMMNRATAESAQDTAEAEGLEPLKQWVKGLVDRVIADEFAAPDLEFRWRDDPASAAAGAAQAAVDYVKCGIKSVNEVRGELGLDPVPGGELPTILTPQGPVALGGGAAGGAAPPASSPLGKYSPDQPRVPAGDSDGGEWTSGDDDGDDDDASDDGFEVAAGSDETEGESGRDSIEGEFFDPTAAIRTELYYAARAKLQSIDPGNPALQSVETEDWVPSAEDVNAMQDALERAIEERAAQAAEHSYEEHVVLRREFSEIGSEVELQALAQHVMTAAKPEIGRNGHIYFYRASDNTLVVVNPDEPEKSTIFRPKGRRQYVDEQL